MSSTGNDSKSRTVDCNISSKAEVPLEADESFPSTVVPAKIIKIIYMYRVRVCNYIENIFMLADIYLYTKISVFVT